MNYLLALPDIVSRFHITFWILLSLQAICQQSTVSVASWCLLEAIFSAHLPRQDMTTHDRKRHSSWATLFSLCSTRSFFLTFLGLTRAYKGLLCTSCKFLYQMFKGPFNDGMAVFQEMILKKAARGCHGSDFLPWHYAVVYGFLADHNWEMFFCNVLLVHLKSQNNHWYLLILNCPCNFKNLLGWINGHSFWSSCFW